MVAPANGRWFFEGMPLGNQAPITFQAGSARGTRGFYPSSRTEYTAPLVGSFGWFRTLLVTGQLVADDGDFLTRLEVETAIDAYLQDQTKLIEDTAERQHNVLQRRLGTVGYVVDVDTYGVVTSLVVNDTAGLPFGTIEITMSPEHIIALGVEERDRVVLTQNLGVGIPTIGEIGTVIAKGETYIQIVSRLMELDGSTPYAGVGDLVVMLCEGFYEGYAFRDTSSNPGRDLAEAAISPGGIAYTFEGIGEFVRRDAVQSMVYSPPDGVLWGATGTKFGTDTYGASS